MRGICPLACPSQRPREFRTFSPYVDEEFSGRCPRVRETVRAEMLCGSYRGEKQKNNYLQMIYMLPLISWHCTVACVLVHRRWYSFCGSPNMAESCITRLTNVQTLFTRSTLRIPGTWYTLASVPCRYIANVQKFMISVIEVRCSIYTHKFAIAINGAGTERTTSEPLALSPRVTVVTSCYTKSIYRSLSPDASWRYPAFFNEKVPFGISAGQTVRNIQGNITTRGGRGDVELF